MRNMEIGVFVAIQLIITAAGCALAFLFAGYTAGIFCIIISLLLICASVGFTLWRYREIKKLSIMLSAAASDGIVLDVRTNKEGELSILKSDIYKVTAALAGQAEHLKREKMFLADTLGDISHQLKTPLTSLTLHCDLLQDDELPKEKRKIFLESMSKQLERVSWLVTSLLKLSRLEADVVNLQKEEINLGELLQSACDGLEALAVQNEAEILMDCPPELSWTGDYNLSREAFVNIIKNCLEHTAAGGRVFINAYETPMNIIVKIEDEGPGFSEEDLPRLFERFYRGQSNEGKGTGIGLSMAKSIFHAQKADITAENRSKGGARFIVKLYGGTKR